MSRRNPPGAIGAGVANVFGGLLVNARDGDSYYVSQRNHGTLRRRVLLNTSAVEGKSPAFTFPHAVFEDAILSRFRELDPTDVIGAAPPDEATVTRNELKWVRERKDELAGELLRGHVGVVADALRGLEAREAELAGKLAEADADAAIPLGQTFEDVKGFARLLAEADDPEDFRLRLRAAIRRLVTKMYVLVVPKGLERIAAVSVYFRGSNARRNYLVFYRPAVGNQSKVVPGRWAVLSVKHPGDGVPFDNFDLREEHLTRATTAGPGLPAGGKPSGT